MIAHIEILVSACDHDSCDSGRDCRLRRVDDGDVTDDPAPVLACRATRSLTCLRSNRFRRLGRSVWVRAESSWPWSGGRFRRVHGKPDRKWARGQMSHGTRVRNLRCLEFRRPYCREPTWQSRLVPSGRSGDAMSSISSSTPPEPHVVLPTRSAASSARDRPQFTPPGALTTAFGVMNWDHFGTIF